MTGKIKRPRGRPLNKPNYDPEEVLKKILSTVCEAYDETKEIKATAAELDLAICSYIDIFYTRKHKKENLEQYEKI